MKNIVIYKVLIGDYDQLIKEMFNTTRDNDIFKFDYVLISDMPISVPPPWRLVLIKRKYSSPAVENRFYKINVPEILNRYDYSIYLDSNISIKDDLSSLMCGIVNDNNYIYAYPHFRNTTIEEEILNCFIFSKISYFEMHEARKFFADSLKNRIGFECGVLVRKKPDDKLCKFQITWFDSYLNNIKRDQFYFMMALDKHGLVCKSLGANNIRGGAGLFFLHPHKVKVGLFKKIIIAMKIRFYGYDKSKKIL